MKVLFFNAVAGHPKVAPPLMIQAWNTLRPFNQFLGQAIHTAKDRQFRYQLPWELVRNLVTIQLTPVDTLLRIPRRQPGVRLTGWPVGKAPDLHQGGFVMNRGVPVTIEEAAQTPEGLVVKTNPPLREDDQVVWCMVTCGVERETSPPPPSTVTDLDGQPLPLHDPPEALGEQHWLLRVEGTWRDCYVIADGEEVAADVVQPEGKLRHVKDEAGQAFDVSGTTIRTEDLPVGEVLLGSDWLRYRWKSQGSEGRRGNWVQLLPPDDDASSGDEFLDPRAAFCEGDVREVWTQSRHRRDSVYKVKRVDPDRYQLLLQDLPPQGSTLYLPVDLRNLYLQKRALNQLSQAPLPHHQGLLRLCEDPGHVRWPRVTSSQVSEWLALTDATRSGTGTQRAFVEKALGTPDFAFLEGPPGSGKTTAICEIVQQLVHDGKRVLLCASTHVAIDNVLERLLDTDAPIDAVRIGRLERVDDKVQQTQLDARIEATLAAWRQQPELRGYGNNELEEMAERTIIMSSNLTCGTTMGIVNHPLFRGRDEDLQRGQRPITTMPHWDVLIIDEASKTLIQEFMVPALMAKRWLIVGDVRQLPPFADRADIVANLRDLVDANDKPVFPRDHQRACLLLFRLLRQQVRQETMRWLISEPAGVLDWLVRELEAQPPNDPLSVVHIVSRKRTSAKGAVQQVTVQQLISGDPEALGVVAADWVMVSSDLLPQVSHLLPADLLAVRALGEGELPETDPLLFRKGWWLERAGALRRAYRDRRFRKGMVDTFQNCEESEQDWLARNDLAQELAWRLTRKHELRHSLNQRERKRLQRDLEWLVPYAADISESIYEIEDIGLPSILEVLQEGIGVERSKRPSTLTQGFRTSRQQDFAARFESLAFQHRMHPDISAFSRDLIYGGQALQDANTIAYRDQKLSWNFLLGDSRRLWADLNGREGGGVNQDEINVIEGLLRHFFSWVQHAGSPARGLPKTWEVACLSFYVKQERAISEMLRRLTGDNRKTRFVPRGLPVEIVCGTVDRFQGREADMVILSMRNTRRVGFLDSPNRLNVAVTRARQQLVVVGNAAYFSRCGVSELEELAKRTPLLDSRSVNQWRRRSS